MDYIRRFIADYIIAHGIKQSYISEKTGITVQKLSAMLSGKRKILADEFLSICKALAIDPDVIAEMVVKGNGKND